MLFSIAKKKQSIPHQAQDKTPSLNLTGAPAWHTAHVKGFRKGIWQNLTSGEFAHWIQQHSALTRSHHSRWEPRATSQTQGIQGGILQPEEDQPIPPAEKQACSFTHCILQNWMGTQQEGGHATLLDRGASIPSHVVGKELLPRGD